MTSKILDLSTMAHALNELSNTQLGACTWVGVSESQRQFLDWYKANRDEVAKLDSLEALASFDSDELNNFLTERGFKPVFEPSYSLGVVSVLDMLVEWIVKGANTTIYTYDPALGESRNFPAFEIAPEGVDVYNVHRYEHPLVRLHTKTGHSLWLVQSDEPHSGLRLNEIARDYLSRDYPVSTEWTAGVRVPMLEMDLEVELDWMTGLSAAVHDVGGEFTIDRAVQQFKLRANDVGARVKVATSFAFESMSYKPEPYVFDRPFIGFFTQPGHDKLPLAAFWADTDSWRNPGGTLEDL